MQAAARLQPNVFFQLVSLLERTFFRVKTVCRGDETKLEKAYQELARVIDTNGNIDLSVVQQRLQEIVNSEAPDPTFESMLAQFQYRPSRSPQLVYFLASLDRLSKVPAEKAVLDVKGHGYTIEHIAPQSGNGAVSDDLLHSLGNLCLLNKTENPKFSDKSFSEKKKLSANGVDLSSRLSAKVFSENSIWTDAEVVARLTFLTTQAKKVFTPSLLL
jgi:hypothetical protein